MSYLILFSSAYHNPVSDPSKTRVEPNINIENILNKDDIVIQWHTDISKHSLRMSGSVGPEQYYGINKIGAQAESNT